MNHGARTSDLSGQGAIGIKEAHHLDFCYSHKAVEVSQLLYPDNNVYHDMVKGRLHFQLGQSARDGRYGRADWSEMELVTWAS